MDGGHAGRHSQLRPQHDVGWLEVAMNDVSGVEADRDLPGDAKALGRRQRAHNNAVRED